MLRHQFHRSFWCGVPAPVMRDLVEADIGEDLAAAFLVPGRPVAVLRIAGKKEMLPSPGKESNNAGVVEQLVQGERHIACCEAGRFL